MIAVRCVSLPVIRILAKNIMAHVTGRAIAKNVGPVAIITVDISVRKLRVSLVSFNVSQHIQIQWPLLTDWWQLLKPIIHNLLVEALTPNCILEPSLVSWLQLLFADYVVVFNSELGSRQVEGLLTSHYRWGRLFFPLGYVGWEVGRRLFISVLQSVAA